MLREFSGGLSGGGGVGAGGFGGGLFQVDWVGVPLVDVAPVEWVDLVAVQGWEGEVPGHVVVRVERPGGGVVEATRAVAAGVLGLVQGWLGEGRFEGSRLVVVTEGGVGVGRGVPDPVLASVWGLVRSARAESPGRFVLVDVDVDGGAESWELVARALTSGEPELAVRGGEVYVPRL
ncbi:SpnB-like Rossmann fold domain-containing protein, partial [Wenjunlia tyrosinilytica]|uniref:SpnB-like Rossmann fold domain-containing protein n=1 Tax=Wenjunlia tyrosinilytica TaxID=1544741 RepID=UPI001E37C9E1